jgi:hypothetical protein
MQYLGVALVLAGVWVAMSRSTVRTVSGET